MSQDNSIKALSKAAFIEAAKRAGVTHGVPYEPMGAVAAHDYSSYLDRVRAGQFHGFVVRKSDGQPVLCFNN